MKRIILALLLLTPTAHADINVIPQDDVTINLSNSESNLAAFSGDLKGLPIIAVNSLDPNKLAKFSPELGRIVVYGYTRDPIKSGDFVSVTFNAEPGSHTIRLMDFLGASGEGKMVSIEHPSTIKVTSYYTTVQLTNTIDQLLGLSTTGVDVNKDGRVNILDVMLVAVNTQP